MYDASGEARVRSRWAGKRDESRRQSGFTLLELLVVIAVLGVLSGVAILGVGKLRERAQIVALDSSLRTLATAAEAQMLMSNMDSIFELRPEMIDVKNTEGMDFSMYDPRIDDPFAEWVIVQARPAGRTEPCRQITFPTDTTPTDCSDVEGQIVYFGNDPKAMEIAAKRADEAKRAAAMAEAGTTSAELEKLKKEAEAKVVEKLTIDTPATKWIKGFDLANGDDPRSWDGKGVWSASFPFTNSTKFDLTVEFVITQHDDWGRMTSSVDKVTALAGTTTPYLVENMEYVRSTWEGNMVSTGPMIVEVRVEAVSAEINGEWVTVKPEGIKAKIERPTIGKSKDKDQAQNDADAAAKEKAKSATPTTDGSKASDEKLKELKEKATATSEAPRSPDDKTADNATSNTSMARRLGDKDRDKQS